MHYVGLTYTDIGVGSQTVVMLHGWGQDRSSLALQATYLASQGVRVISPDLRGHGCSPAPVGDYSMSAMADDVAELCGQLGLREVVVVGHSMGGVVGLHLTSRTTPVSGLVMIDSFLFPSEDLVRQIECALPLMEQAAFADNYAQMMSHLAGPHDSSQVCRQIHDFRPRAPQHVLASALKAHFDFDSLVVAAERCRVPVAYIAARHPLADLITFREHTPQVITAQTLGSGHFSPLCVPDQVNAMLLDFLRLFGGHRDG